MLIESINLEKKVSFFSPAKINLSLKIGDLQKNGLHEINSEAVKISFFDQIDLQISSRFEPGKILFFLENKKNFDVPNDEKNLAIVAIKKFFNAAGMEKKFPGIEIRLQKNIPPKSGLGGGSSNAGVVLRNLHQIFPKLLQKIEIEKIAASLGSDVPFFFQNIFRGQITKTGEKIISTKKTKSIFFVVIIPKNLSISTKWAFLNFAKFRKTLPGNFSFPANYFEPFLEKNFPIFQKIKEKFLNLGAEKAGISGSGSSVFAIFQNVTKAKFAISQFDKKKYWIWSGKNLIIS